MKISLIVPSHRQNIAAIAKILEWSSLNHNQFELIVRDNSCDKKKREIIESISSRTLNYYCVEECSAIENGMQALTLANGDFVYFLADDDWVSLRGLSELYRVAEQYSKTQDVSIITGAYLVETSNGNGIFQYPQLDSPNVTERIENYLKANAPNFLYYSAVRKNIIDFGFSILNKLPYKFSFHDQLMSLIYLTLGKVTQIQRIVYGYDMGEWDSREKTLQKDRNFYTAAGLPIEYDRLHHLFCGLEGALLLDSSEILSRAENDTSTSSQTWFNAMYSKFIHDNREIGYSDTPAGRATLQLKKKLEQQKNFYMNEILLDVCDVLEVADPEGAQRYFKFWATL